MALKETVERLRRLKDDAPSKDDTVDEWRSAVSDLYDRITDWLTPFLDDKAIALERRPKSAYEEQIGDYDIDMLDIDVGPETVRLDPRGAVVIGARGRIDMTLLGRGEPLMLILSEGDGEPGWFVVERQRRTTLTPLTKDVFEASLEKLLEDFDLRPGPSV